MKHILFSIFLIFSSHYVMAETPVTPEMADKYFQNCLAGAQKQNQLSPENQKHYCACTAINMQKNMSQEDVAALSNKDKSARLALNKVLIHVNGPCLQYPVHDMLYNQCMKTLGTQNICECVGNKTGKYMSKISGTMLPKILADNPEIYDPMTPILESKEFQQAQQEIAMSCATNPNAK